MKVILAIIIFLILIFVAPVALLVIILCLALIGFWQDHGKFNLDQKIKEKRKELGYD